MLRLLLFTLALIMVGCSNEATGSPGVSTGSPLYPNSTASVSRSPDWATLRSIQDHYSRPAQSEPVIYVDDTDRTKVWIVPQAGRDQEAIGSINLPNVKGGKINEPLGLAVDAAGNLYVVSYDNPKGFFVFVYKPGATSPFRTLTSGSPDQIAVDGSGTVYVNCVENVVCLNFSVEVYAPGSSQPTATLSDANLSFVAGMAVDAAGDLFVSGGEDSHEIDEFPAGQTNPVIVNTNFDSPYSIEFDAEQHLVVADLNQSISIIAPPYNGKPLRRVAVNCQVNGLALNSTNTALWYDCGGRAYQLTYPGLKKVESTAQISSFLYGLAADPSSPL